MNDETKPAPVTIKALLAQLDPTRRKLMQDKFGSWLEWKPPETAKTIGPYDPNAFKPFQDKLVNLFKSCLAKLALVPDETIEPMVSGNNEDGKAKLRSFFNEEHTTFYSLFQKEPPWHAAGFGHPDHIADFEYWAKMSKYSLLEITCLSIGIHPKDFPEEKVLSLEKKTSEDLLPTLRFFLDRLELLGREFGHRYQGMVIFPARFLAWAEKMEFEVHPDFWQLLKKYHGGRQAEADPVFEQPLRTPDKREIDKIAQLFTLMAIDHLGYRPGNKRNNAPNEISDLAAKHGGSVSEDTVRKYLRIGSRFLSDAAKDGHI